MTLLAVVGCKTDTTFRVRCEVRTGVTLYYPLYQIPMHFELCVRFTFLFKIMHRSVSTFTCVAYTQRSFL